MEQSTSDSLATGLIHPSSFPMGALFFFVMGPCIRALTTGH